MISFSIQNFGCRVNQAEAFSWAEEFQRQGWRLERDFSRSQVIVVNTCTLTARAERDVRKFLQRIIHTNPGAKLVLTGCAVERGGEDFEKTPNLLKLLANREKENLAQQVVSLVGSKKSPKDIPDFHLPFRSRAILKVQDGCDFACTFCIIPKVRGRSISYPREVILHKCQELFSQGFPEIVLTGIHLCSYGCDLRPRSSLLGLLQDIEKINRAGKIRLSSLDPRFLELSLLRYLTRSPQVCPHFHLSLQHGSDRILRLMGRKSHVEEYREIIHFLRRNSPHAAIGADIIAGFPGETDADFQATFNFLQKSHLTYFHVFPYSPRPGTEAGSKRSVEGKMKRERTEILRKLSAEKNFNFRRRFLGQQLPGIVVKKKDLGCVVLTPNYLKIFLPFHSLPEQEEVRVRIIEVNPQETVGELAKGVSLML